MGLLAKQYIVTGVLQKTDPLPIGRYWIDVSEYRQDTWQLWVAHAGNKIQILVTEHTEGKSGIPTPSNPSGQQLPDLDWYLFEVKQPVSWPAAVSGQLGWPTVAGPEVHSQSDTTTAPQAVDESNKQLDEKYGWIKWAVLGTVGVAGLFAVAKLVRG